MSALVLSVLLVLQTAAAPANPTEQRVTRPWLGMALTVRTSPTGAKFLYVGQVGPGTPAHRAGLRAGDVITRFRGVKTALRDDLDVIQLVARLRVGESLPITFVRAGQEMRVTLVVGRLPAEYEPAWKSSLERATREREAAKRH